jgi:hypothetical protein
MGRVIYIPIEEDEYFERIAEVVVKKMRTLGFSFDNPKPLSKWLNHSEAARYIRKTPAALYKLTSERKVKYNKRGKSNYYLQENLDKYLSEGEVLSADEIKNEVNLLPKRNHFLTRTK